VIALGDLQGVWRLERAIEDRRAGVTGRFVGRAVWRPDGAGLRQAETGVLHYGAAPPMQGARVYLWRAEGGGLAVFFEDGRLFHRLAPGHLRDTHRCDPDIYDVSYDFTGWPVWRQVWRVNGPRKDAVLTSVFKPEG
jgi:hypothetical protein